MNGSSSNNIAILNKEYLITKLIIYIELIKDFTTQNYYKNLNLYISFI